MILSSPTRKVTLLDLEKLFDLWVEHYVGVVKLTQCAMITRLNGEREVLRMSFRRPWLSL